MIQYASEIIHELTNGKAYGDALSRQAAQIINECLMGKTPDTSDLPKIAEHLQQIEDEEFYSDDTAYDALLLFEELKLIQLIPIKEKEGTYYRYKREK